MRRPPALQRGLTLPEILVSAFIVLLIGGALYGMFGDNFKLARRAYRSLSAQQDVQILSRRFLVETRSAVPSEVGAYAIQTASSGEFTFYTDADDDGMIERVRYFVSGTELRKGITNPIGNPLTYTGATEQVRTVVRDVAATTTPVFTYYGATYSGGASSTPLTVPVDVSQVRLIQLTITVDADATQPPEPAVFSTQVTFRTLKDNL